MQDMGQLDKMRACLDTLLRITSDMLGRPQSRASNML